MTRSAKNPATELVDPSVIRGQWSSIVAATTLRFAAMLNLVGADATTLRAIPDPAYEVAFRKGIELRDWAVCKELELKTRPRWIEETINRDLWNTLKPFAREGEHYIGHLSGEVPRGTIDSMKQSTFGEKS